MKFIKREFERRQNIFGPAIPLIIKGSRRHLADIRIDEKIGIELKRNLKGKTEIDNLDEQINDFVSQYSCILVVLCGEISDETVDDVKYRLKKRLRSMGFGQQGPRVKVIKKDEAALKRAKNKPESPFSLRPI